MILQIFAVRDGKTAQFANPMFLITKAHAIRTFADAVNDPGTREQPNQLNTHPEDFEVFHLGDYDTDTGVINAKPPTSVCTATELKKNQ